MANLKRAVSGYEIGLGTDAPACYRMRPRFSGNHGGVPELPRQPHNLFRRRMMAQWFRYYVATLAHHKVQSLPTKLFRHWINLLCVAAGADDDGRLPGLYDVAFALRVKPTTADNILKQLHKRELLDYEYGAYVIHDWRDWQYNSDVSTERVKRFRQRQKKPPRNVSVTPSDTDTDTDTEKTPTPTPSPEGADAVQEPFNLTEQELQEGANGKGWKDAKFKEFWDVVWFKRATGRAREAFDKAATSPQAADKIIAAAVKQGPEIVRDAEDNKHSLLHPSTWLNGKRYLDEGTRLRVEPLEQESDPEWAQ